MPEWDQARVAAASRRLRLTVDPRRKRSGAGQHLGNQAGSGLEFHDYRDYHQGDDPRRVDWRAYARTGQLLLRRHRQEVQPRLDMILDASASMAFTNDKFSLAAALTDLLTSVALREGSRTTVFIGNQRLDASVWREQLLAASAEQNDPIMAVSGQLHPGSERILISDGLQPTGATAVLRPLGQAAGSISLVQVLSREEIKPVASGATRLQDLEQRAQLDLICDQQACAAYRARLARHQQAWSKALRGRGAGLFTCVAEEGLQAAIRVCLRGLLAMGVG
jgi:uncharacterized protein (DUF58 family)